MTSDLCSFHQVAGGRNVPGAVMYVAIKSIENSRKMRYQSLNAYRKRFSMKPYSSFEDITGETKTRMGVMAIGTSACYFFVNTALPFSLRFLRVLSVLEKGNLRGQMCSEAPDSVSSL